MELFKSMAGIEMTRVPYKGSDLSMIDLMSGRIKGIAVTSATRSAAFPDFPTIAESGVAGYELESWYGILAPRKTPLAVIDILNAHINAVIALPEFKGRLRRRRRSSAVQHLR
jgi:tripartite-type tricarboxylate transporter receptor subunit TctC